jgi:hypothetical protein
MTAAIELAYTRPPPPHGTAVSGRRLPPRGMREPDANRAGSAQRRTLSVCCMTAAPPARVAALVRLYSRVADEVFVAVDDRVDLAVAGAAAAAGARVVLYPYAEPVDRPLAWLHDQCSGEWVLTVDDDEVPSPGLLGALPRLLAADDVTHYWIPRRWLYPDAAHYLDEAPWRPDYQLRLVENDPRLLRFFEETHRPIEVVGPGRYLDQPVYHGDCVLNPPDRRAEKARKYERMGPGKRVVGGAMNHVYYLPERRPAARLAPLPDADLELVGNVLGARDVPAPAAEAVEPRAATRSEIDRLWVGAELADADYRAEIEPLQDLGGIAVREQRTVDARITNRGGRPWPWGKLGRPEIRVSYRWLRTDGAGRGGDGPRTPFYAPVRPGETTLVPVHVIAPDVAGRHVLELDIVHEHVRWFGCGVRMPVDVQPARRVAVAGAGKPLERALERLADAAPELEPVVLACGDYVLPPVYGQRRGPAADAYLLAGARGSRLLAAPRLAARTLGVTVVLDEGAVGPETGPLDRALARLIRRRASAEPLEAAARPAG